MSYRPTYISNVAPTVDEDYSEGYRNGNFWYNTVSATLYVLVDHTDGAADWDAISSSSVAAWADWTPTFQWTGNTPVGVSYVASYQEVGSLIFFTLDVSATNDTGADITNMNCSLPESVEDNDNLIPVDTYSVIAGACSNYNVAYIDGENNVEASRKLMHAAFGAITASQAFGLYFRGFYEKYSP